MENENFAVFLSTIALLSAAVLGLAASLDFLKLLRNQVENARVSHAFLFFGIICIVFALLPLILGTRGESFHQLLGLFIVGVAFWCYSIIESLSGVVPVRYPLVYWPMAGLSFVAMSGALYFGWRHPDFRAYACLLLWYAVILITRLWFTAFNLAQQTRDGDGSKD